MRTTLEIDDALAREAKRRALEEGRTLTAMVHDALSQYLSSSEPPSKPFRLRLLTKKGKSIPGVNPADRDALYEVMEGRG